MWKSVGGINNSDSFSDMNLNQLTCNTLSLRDAYVGNFTICGELFVQNPTVISDILIINGDVSMTSHVFGNDVSINNLTIAKKTQLIGPTIIGNNASTYITGSVSGISINNNNSANATLDIYTGTIDTLHLSTTNNSNRNILAKNKSNYGITHFVDNSSAIIDMFHSGTTINSNTHTNSTCQLIYDASGVFSVNSDKILVKGNTQFNNSNLPMIVPTIDNNEPVIIFTSPSIPLVKYKNTYDPSYNSSIALSLISTDSSANSFINLASKKGKGWLMGGGVLVLIHFNLELDYMHLILMVLLI